MASKEKLFKKGNRLIILTETYVNNFNIFLDSMSDKIKAQKYNMDVALSEIENGKETRPIIILWANENHDYVVAFSVSSSQSNYNKKFLFKMNDNFWKSECLILNRNKTFLVNNSVSEKISFEDIDDFMIFLKKKFNHTYEFIERTIQKFELEAEINLLKKENEKNN